MKIKLRAHHLLCIQGYQGYGYSDEFVKNMDHIVEILKNNNNLVVLCNSADDICKFCPNLNEDGFCKDFQTNEDIVLMDEIILSKIKNSEKEFLTSELFEEINNIFNSEDSVKTICGDCGWIDKCLFYQNFL
ncbi:MAG: DUF1284 domain-containing protein [Methanobacteriaceae archaeon]|jgi:hypothetical protein|uniref:DUF1284 domain-containing protein n=1 Tax=unclassified Methanobrevibacter TaxID=2638681 RepID=UPI002A134311|nr:DUF1284 domain-containing protein [Methanobacteriaceae archaeon]MDD3408176.1 DUF1284 domain-containing protein [Methanobacteriaceae archaeon]MDD4594072.1 DUF1284 domain-containing protein [Methanobacteriaceae archaeon]